MARIKLNISERKLKGRKVKTLRGDGVIPANIYGKGVKSKAVKADLKLFVSVFKQAGETSLVDLQLEKKLIPVLIHNVQVDPVTDSPIHADFLQVNLKEKVTAQIPIELVGESPAVKQGLGTVVNYISEIEVEALPTDLPEKFEIDMTKLQKVDEMVEVKDLKVDAKKIEVKENLESIIVKVEPLREEEEEPVVQADEEVEGEGEAEGEVEGEGEAKVAGEEDNKEEDKKVSK